MNFIKQMESHNTQYTLNNVINDHIEEGKNVVYPLTNESGVAETIERLVILPKVKNSCHIGISCFYNFDIIFARKSKYAVLFDQNPSVKIFLHKVFSCINDCTTRFDFIEKIEALLGKDSDYSRIDESKIYIDDKLIYFDVNCEHATTLKQISCELLRKESWLYNEESFRYIQSLIKDNKIFVLTEDMNNTEQFYKLKTTLDGLDIMVDSLYTSNVSNYVNKDLYDKFIRTIINNNTIIINCKRIQSHDDSNKENINLIQQIRTIDNYNIIEKLIYIDCYFRNSINHQQDLQAEINVEIMEKYSVAQIVENLKKGDDRFYLDIYKNKMLEIQNETCGINNNIIYLDNESLKRHEGLEKLKKMNIDFLQKKILPTKLNLL